MDFMRSGQALLIVLLVLAVALTVGLSIASRSITEVSVSTSQEESARALSAAEAGVEQALGGIATGGPGTAVPGSTTEKFTVTNNTLGNSNSFVFNDMFAAGDVATVALDNNLGSTVIVCVGKQGDPATGAEITYYYRPGISYAVGRRVYDPSNRMGANGGTAVAVSSCPVAAWTWAWARSFNVATDLTVGPGGPPLSLRIRLFFNGSTQEPVGAVTSGGVNPKFPSQGSQIVSVGQAGQSTQKVQVFEGNPDVPPVFDTALYSGGSLQQQ